MKKIILTKQYYFTKISTLNKVMITITTVLIIGGILVYGYFINNSIDKNLITIATVAPQAVITDPNTAQDAWYQTNYANHKSKDGQPITLTRGYAPFPVFLEGWQSLPRNEIIDYAWDFGDNNAYNGNPNELHAFNGAHIYEQPGTYTAKLTVKNRSGQVSTASIEITVLAPDNLTYYIDSAVGNDANDGLSPQTAWQTADKAFAGVAAKLYQPGDRILFKRSQTFEAQKSFTLGNVASHSYSFSAYGDGAKPIIQYMGTSSNLTYLNGLTRRVGHIGFVDLNFEGLSNKSTATTQYFSQLIHLVGGNRNFLFLRVEGYDPYNSFISADGVPDSQYPSPYPHGLFIFDSIIANRQATAPFTSIQLYALADRLALVNSTLDQSGNHDAYLPYLNKALIYNNTFSRPACGRTALRLDGGDTKRFTNNVAIVSNRFLGWRDNLSSISAGSGRAGGSHNCRAGSSGVRYNFSLVEIAPNGAYGPPHYSYYNYSPYSSGWFDPINVNLAPNLDGAGTYAGKKLIAKIEAIDTVNLTTKISLYTTGATPTTTGQLVLGPTAVPSGRNIREFLKTADSSALISSNVMANIDKSTGQVALETTPKLMSSEYITLENNVFTNAERWLKIVATDNVTVRNNLFISPTNYTSRRLEIGDASWEWRPIRHLKIIGNTFLTKSAAGGINALLNINSPGDNWQRFYFDGSACPQWNNVNFGCVHQDLVFKDNIIVLDTSTNAGKLKVAYLENDGLLSAISFGNNIYYVPGNESALFQSDSNSYNLTDWQTKSGETGSLTADPKLVKSSTYTHSTTGGYPASVAEGLIEVSGYIANLRILDSNSPAINLDKSSDFLDLLAFDFNRLTRPYSTGLDAGAFELDINLPPVAQINLSTAAGPAPLTVKFDGSLSTDSDGTISAYNWDYGDGQTGSGQVTTHTYNNFGTYLAALTVTDNRGATAMATTTIGVTEIEIPPSSTAAPAVLHLKFDDDPAGGVIDSSVYNHLATGQAVNLTSGQLGGAYAFTSSAGSYVLVPNHPTLNATSSLSIALWVKPTSWSGNPRLMEKGTTGKADTQYRLYSNKGKDLIFQLSGVNSSVSIPLPPVDGKWHHIAATYSATEKRLRIYLDGQEKKNSYGTGNIAITSDPLYIGTKNAAKNPSDTFNGSLDDVRLYNRTLSAAEVAGLAASQDLP